MRFIDWLIGKNNRNVITYDTGLSQSVEQEIARSVATRQQLERKIARRYPLIADQLLPYRGDQHDPGA